MMTFGNLANNEKVFLDSNTLVYGFATHPVFGLPCQTLLDRIERKELEGYTSSHVLGEMGHRLMTIEASALFGWPFQGVAHRLKRHPPEVQRLSVYRQAIDEASLIGLQVLPVTGALVSLAADASRQFGLLTNDALIVAIMRQQGMTNLASNDSDFDRVPGIIRYAPA